MPGDCNCYFVSGDYINGFLSISVDLLARLLFSATVDGPTGVVPHYLCIGYLM